jgi:hypothetical protein
MIHKRFGASLQVVSRPEGRAIQRKLYWCNATGVNLRHRMFAERVFCEGQIKQRKGPNDSNVRYITAYHCCDTAAHV